MADNIKAIPFNTSDEGVDYPTLAKHFVWHEIRELDLVVKFEDIYVVSFTYILGGWKAMVSTSCPDGKYYEVAHKPEHDGTDGPETTFVDTYIKIANSKYTAE